MHAIAKIKTLFYILFINIDKTVLCVSVKSINSLNLSLVQFSDSNNIIIVAFFENATIEYSSESLCVSVFVCVCVCSICK